MVIVVTVHVGFFRSRYFDSVVFFFCWSFDRPPVCRRDHDHLSGTRESIGLAGLSRGRRTRPYDGHKINEKRDRLHQEQCKSKTVTSIETGAGCIIVETVSGMVPSPDCSRSTYRRISLAYAKPYSLTRDPILPHHLISVGDGRETLRMPPIPSFLLASRAHPKVHPSSSF
jgi:hypothetical protein